uniref:Coupling protein VirD4, ATPase required for T-DNA transfer n=1 Tax=Vibrio sp. FF_291 TaxID=1652832 RepID=A0A0H3ZT12_9VIBR|nr:Coupling protein VirD4, ATPase required for T-DNA transfer [Vibrio sp. FF_291]
MSFKVNPVTSTLKISLSLVLSYTTTIILIGLFYDTAAFQNLKSPFHYFGDAPYSFYLYPFGLYMLLALVGIVVFSYVSDDYGDAREATASEIEEMGLFAEEGLILGKTRDFFFPRFVRTDQPLSTFLIAPPGTGKTAAIITPNLLSCFNSMVINDPKLELWNTTSAQRGRMGSVGLFAPTLDLGKEKSLCFNPFSADCLPNDFSSQIDFIDRLLTIIYPTGDDIDNTTNYFNTNAKNLFMFWALRRVVMDGETSLPRIYQDATETSDQQAAIASIMENQALPTYIRQKGNSLLDMDTREFKSTATSFINMLEPFNRPSIRKYFEACDFSYKDFRQAKTFSIYLGVPPRDEKRMRPIIKLMMQYLTLELLSDVKLYSKKQVTFILDEFARLGKVQELIESPELSRGCNMNFLFACQSVNQIKKIYNSNGGDAMQGLIDVCDYTIIYTQNDKVAAEYLSGTIGKTTRKKQQSSKKFGEITGNSTVSLEGYPFVTEQDLLNMGKDDLIVAVKGFKKRPIMCKKPWHWKEPKFRKLIGAYNNWSVGVDDDLMEEAIELESEQQAA